MTILEVIEYGRRQKSQSQDTEFLIGLETSSEVYRVPYDKDKEGAFLRHIPVQALSAKNWELKTSQKEDQTSLPHP